jgi:hypothetical protein
MIEDVNNFNVLTSEQEKNKRLNLCNSCSSKTKIQDDEICQECACPITYVTTYKFKMCPLKKWTLD